MKSILFGLLFAAAVLSSHAEEEAKPKEGEIKIYKRLIPADVLRGELKISVRFVVKSGAAYWDCLVDQEPRSKLQSRLGDLVSLWAGDMIDLCEMYVHYLNNNSLRHSRRLWTIPCMQASEQNKSPTIWFN